MTRIGSLRRSIGLSIAALMLGLAGTISAVAPASAAIYYGDVYIHVACNPGYYPSTTYGGASNYWMYVTYYGYTGYWFHWQVRTDSGIASSQTTYFNLYCNGMYGQPSYRKARISQTVYSRPGYSYYRSA